MLSSDPSTAVVSVRVSPRPTTASPWACLAILPVSRNRVWPPSCVSTRHACTEHPSNGWGQPSRGAAVVRRRDRLRRGLLPQAEPADDREVAGPVLVPQVVEQAGALADHHEQ